MPERQVSHAFIKGSISLQPIIFTSIPMNPRLLWSLLIVLAMVGTSSATSWIVPGGITQAGTIQAIAATTTTNNVFTQSIGEPAGQLAFGTDLQ
jgi:hypothetical protein